jgi:glycosyltransferase involved in cell wall biosynthesis
MEQTHSYFIRPIILLPYWIDTSLFYPLSTDQKNGTRLILGIPQDKIIIGNFQRDTEADLVTPKLEKGPDIFCDIIESLDPQRYYVLLAGPRRNYVENRLKQHQFLFKNLGKIPYSQMNQLYNAIDYYFVTSRCEGGPQAILEAMATKTKIYSTPVGISDILSQQVICSAPHQFTTALTKLYSDSVIETHYQTAQQFNCQKVVKYYEETFMDLYAKHKLNTSKWSILNK